MSNSPIVVSKTEEGVTTTSVQTLAPCIPQTTPEKAAETGNFAIVYLERILGKVEVKASTGTGWKGWTYKVTTEGLTKGDSVTFTKWGLDVTNTTTYPVRQVNNEWISYGANDYLGTATKNEGDLTYGGNRFIGADMSPQRIYYAIDPNYSSLVANDFTNLTSLPNTLSSAADAKNIDYCLENTFDEKNQNQNQTTRVVMQANYTLSGATADDSEDFYRMSGLIYSQKALFADIKEKFGLNADVTSIGMTAGEGNNASAVTASAKEVKITSITTSEGEITSADIDANAAFATYPTLDYYKGGVCYYVARIKHFGDLLTPWAYGAGYTAKDHLGRYGVVRNNWYELTITKADKGPGEPVIPPTPETPDDEMTYYIDAQIHILSWAKRTQDVEW